jgi:hypothetical protein
MKPWSTERWVACCALPTQRSFGTEADEDLSGVVSGSAGGQGLKKGPPSTAGVSSQGISCCRVRPSPSGDTKGTGYARDLEGRAAQW